MMLNYTHKHMSHLHDIIPLQNFNVSRRKEPGENSKKQTKVTHTRLVFIHKSIKWNLTLLSSLHICFNSYGQRSLGYLCICSGFTKFMPECCTCEFNEMHVSSLKKLKFHSAESEEYKTNLKFQYCITIIKNYACTKWQAHITANICII